MDKTFVCLISRHLLQQYILGLNLKANSSCIIVIIRFSFVTKFDFFYFVDELFIFASKTKLKEENVFLFIIRHPRESSGC